MASKGLRVISYQGTRKVEAGYKPSHTAETLNGYIVCYMLGFIHYQSFKISNLLNRSTAVFEKNSF